MNVLVLINSASCESKKGLEYVIPYLDHFGIPYTVFDINGKKIAKNAESCPLVIISHADIGLKNESIKNDIGIYINAVLKNGGGVVTFDPFLPEIKAANENSVKSVVEPSDIKIFEFNQNRHYITECHRAGEKLNLFGPMKITPVESDALNVLIESNGYPLLTAAELNGGRLVRWVSQDWMHTSVLGPLAGLDDCLWRSFVWAAKKPFALRGLPPIVTMRVDDVAGQGVLFNRNPLYWVETANKYGFKPWLGLFIYNLRPEAVKELRGYILNGSASVFPHALGRPPRTPESDFYYYPEAIPLTTDEYDEFIYFDHARKTPFPDDVVEMRLKAVDDWWEKQQPFPMSLYAICHWYETGGNVIHHIADKWNIEFISRDKDINLPWDDSSLWIKGGPFRLYEEPGTSSKNPELRGGNPVYYADFITIENRTFFNCYTEIRDDAGYEWSPDNDVEASVGRGVRQLRRALDSFALAVLFTHETDFIFNIKPENWENEIKCIAEGISDYNPIFLTVEEALKIVRATKTSRLESFAVDKNNGSIKLNFTGKADVPTGCYIFTEKDGEIVKKLVNIPSFDKETIVETNL